MFVVCIFVLEFYVCLEECKSLSKVPLVIEFGFNFLLWFGVHKSSSKVP